MVCNLYPFREVSERQDSTLEDAIEQIDVGGVALLRAAAKNFSRVITLCDPEDYGLLEEALSAGTEIDLATRRSLANKVFELTQAYDAAICSRLQQEGQEASQDGKTPARLTQTFYRSEVLRYGENPHQQAAWYSLAPGAGPLGGELLGGQRQLSYNNYLDLDAAARAVRDFPTPTVAVVKHLSPSVSPAIKTWRWPVNGRWLRIPSRPLAAYLHPIACERSLHCCARQDIC